MAGLIIHEGFWLQTIFSDFNCSKLGSPHFLHRLAVHFFDCFWEIHNLKILPRKYVVSSTSWPRKIWPHAKTKERKICAVQCCQNFLGENPISHAKNPTFCDFFIPPPKIAKNLTPLTVFIAFFLTNAAENFNFGYLKKFICRICFLFMVLYLKKESHH